MSEKITCPRCGGRGWTEVYTETGCMPIQVPCPDCGGAGVVPHGEKGYPFPGTQPVEEGTLEAGLDAALALHNREETLLARAVKAEGERDEVKVQLEAERKKIRELLPEFIPHLDMDCEDCEEERPHKCAECEFLFDVIGTIEPLPPPPPPVPEKKYGYAAVLRQRDEAKSALAKVEERSSDLAGFLDDCTNELKQTRALLRELLADVYEVLEDGRHRWSGPPHLELCKRVDAYLNPPPSGSDNPEAPGPVEIEEPKEGEKRDG